MNKTIGIQHQTNMESLTEEIVAKRKDKEALLELRRDLQEKLDIISGFEYNLREVRS